MNQKESIIQPYLTKALTAEVFDIQPLMKAEALVFGYATFPESITKYHRNFLATMEPIAKIRLYRAIEKHFGIVFNMDTFQIVASLDEQATPRQEPKKKERCYVNKWFLLDLVYLAVGVAIGYVFWGM